MAREKRLSVVLLLNLLLVTALVIIGLWAHSLGVLAAGGDYIADAAAIGLSLFAIRLSRRPPSPRRPDGYPNATNIAALVNGGWLLALSVLIIVAATRRLASGTSHIEGLPVLIVSAVAAGVMVVGAFILGGDIDDERPSTRPATAPKHRCEQVRGGAPSGRTTLCAPGAWSAPPGSTAGRHGHEVYRRLSSRPTPSGPSDPLV